MLKRKGGGFWYVELPWQFNNIPLHSLMQSTLAKESLEGREKIMPL